jgi:hypothetical protein
MHHSSLVQGVNGKRLTGLRIGGPKANTRVHERQG